jgi:alpha-L-fucosidase 2
MLRIPSPEATFDLVPPAGMSKLGYDPAPVIRDQNMIRFNQRAANGLMFSIVAVWRVVGDETIAAVSVFTNREDGAFGALAPFRLRDSLDQGYDKLFKLHTDWWTKFWSPSSVTIPDEKAQQHYNLVKYFYGAASRRGAPPMPLQGVWTADNGDLPPWKGDYHNDLNTQTTYIAYQTAGLFESGMTWIEFNNKLMPRYRKFAQEFYGLKGGIVVPGVMTLDGSPMGGWGMYSLSPTNGAWIAHNFIRHWRTRDDDDELKKTIYPFCREIGFGIAGLLKPTADGKLRLPLSSSPEIHDNSLRAWLKPNSNYDLALMKELFSSLAEMASKVNQIGEASFWYEKLDRLEDFTTDETGLIFSEGEPVKGSHRHFSHLMAIHPLDVLDLDNSKDRELAQKSVDHMLKQGTDWWTGYSFSWMACMLAKMGDGERANDHLEKYLKGFILRNGFHCNGDQSGTGLSKMTYRPFTLEGNFLAMEAVHLMLLKSNKRGIEVFPAVPKKWDNASFVDLRAEGGFKVSARRAGGSTISVKVVATTDSVIRLKDPFGGEGRAIWSGQGFRREGDSIIAILRAGQGIRGELR